MQNEHYRRKLVTLALTLTEGTTLAPSHYEQQLLEQYVYGILSIDEIINLVATQPVSGPKDDGPFAA